MKKIEYILSILIYRVLAFFLLLPALIGVTDFIGIKIEFIKNIFNSLDDDVFWSGHQLYNRGFGESSSGVSSSASNLPIYLALMAIASAILLTKKIKNV